jgi:predicted nuclease of predicted toxin-antitoxin system
LSLLAADENLNNKLVRGLQRLNRGIDILRVQDAGLRGADDPAVLAWASAESRILIPRCSNYGPLRLPAGRGGPADAGVFEIGTSAPDRSGDRGDPAGGRVQH